MNMSPCPVVVVGDIILDEYWYGVSERISPEAPVPVVLKKQSTSRLGGAANVALNIKTLEVPVHLVGVLGQDEAGAKVNALLQEHEIGTSLVQEPGLTTIQKLRILANNHYIGRVDFEEPFTPEPQELWARIPESVEYCVLSDYGKGTLTSSKHKSVVSLPEGLIQNLNAKGCKVLVDPKASFDNYQGAWLIKPNKKEFETYVGEFYSREDLIQKAQEALKTHGISNMLVTLGSEGMMLISENQHQHWPSEALDVFDVTGAGDTVIATLASFMAKGSSLVEAVVQAGKAAAIAVGKKGVYNVKLQELS
ncbi:MAG: PfkB family carbohydrate kinase [Bdellovibrionaceae bacterium]|nr:PfkB family carbohydrate kinase [Pseudobdellovibrionaceae bacterium]